MGWGQRAAHFFCSVRSARKNDEIILSNKNEGISIKLACEEGGLDIRVWWSESRQRNMFEIDLIPWRKSESSKTVHLAHGELHHDKLTNEEITVRLSTEVMEAFRLVKATEIMSGEDS